MKIFISVSNIVDIGGISTALINLLNEISDNNEITLCAINNYISPNKKIQIPSSIKILAGSSFLEDCFGDRSKMSGQNSLRKYLRFYRRCLRKTLGREWAIQNGVKRIIVEGEYDVAIAFSNNLYDRNGVMKNGGNYDLVLHNVIARRKIAWIHNDARECGFTTDLCEKMFKDFDAIVNVSYDCKNIFDIVSPNTISKSRVVYNMFDIASIKEKAGNDSPYQTNNKMHFVTVCRLKNQQKRLDRICKVVSDLKMQGYYDFDWTIVGDGEDRKTIEEMITEYNINDMITLVGLQSNPYPYMKFADAFVLSSLYEGYPMTVKEAQILCTPTLVTHYGSADEGIQNKQNGLICENSTKGLFNMIRSVLDDRNIVDGLRCYLQHHPVDNKIALKQFYSVCTGGE